MNPVPRFFSLGEPNRTRTSIFLLLKATPGFAPDCKSSAIAVCRKEMATNHCFYAGGVVVFRCVSLLVVSSSDVLQNCDAAVRSRLAPPPLTCFKRGAACFLSSEKLPELSPFSCLPSQGFSHQIIRFLPDSGKTASSTCCQSLVRRFCGGHCRDIVSTPKPPGLLLAFGVPVGGWSR